VAGLLRRISKSVEVISGGDVESVRKCADQVCTAN